MPLEIIGVGFGRTGTLSTYTALNELGFPCYHMVEVMGGKKKGKTNKSHVDFWLKVANAPAGLQHHWEDVFSQYTAALDNPACCVWRELMVAYPDAKLLLTLHPKGADTWYRSTIETIYAPSKIWALQVLKHFIPALWKMDAMGRKLIWERFHQGTLEDRAKAIALYHKHIEDVKAAVPAGRLLIFSADQGWEPLCRFLGVAAPDRKFPNVNDRASMKKRLMLGTVAAYGILILGALAVGGALYGAVQLLN
jgi:hypothetical protein